ncbi:translocating chain-associated membrane protein 1 [Trichonephila inaurata madagascariensis]|uniref:Translocating chain-associated membrane protein 1 n=1 Tax=Trichonephila inaurata madagascariensis TaxID=2747483 RepID=A0A8X7CA17_9ARAC|nr:translocating chain-associated membrane protein 1 [Trichonephila inaurata madagascariensis]
MPIKRRTGSKNPPIFSSEFLIQNHADIVSCLAMVFVIGLLFQVSAPLASVFVVMQHNVTEAVEPTDTVLYTYGRQDVCVISFYFLIAIVMHAILQEYALDKLNKKLHLSKMKHSKFNESGQLLVFYLISLIWGGDIVLREGYLWNISKLWQDYPHNEMTFMFKFYFVVQLAYWLHCYPELYFQKVKKDEMKPRIIYTTLYLVFLSAAYVLNFTRVAICLSVLHYLVESVFHSARLLYFADKAKAASYGFTVWNSLFVFARLGSITLSVLTFWYGLALQQTTSVMDIASGNFNTQLIRINCLVSICLLQAWMMWNFINFHLKRMRERAALLASTKKKALAKKDKKLKKDELKKASEEDVNELPEVDQNTKKDLRSRTGVASSPKSKKH